MQQLYIKQTLGWRALLAQAQSLAAVQVSPAVEEHLVNLLYRYVSAGDVGPHRGLLRSLEEYGRASQNCPSQMGDHCLLFTGLFPEHLVKRGLRPADFAALGQSAYGQHAARTRSARHETLAGEFILAMDVLQTLRALHSGSSFLDGFSAFELWNERGSRYSWQVLQTLTRGTPVSGCTSQRYH